MSDISLEKENLAAYMIQVAVKTVLSLQNDTVKVSLSLVANKNKDKCCGHLSLI